MKRIYILLFLFLFLILEGVAIKFLPPSILLGDQMFVPHWILIVLILVEMFFDRGQSYNAILYAFIFGLLIDIVYTGILGVYMFSYGIVIYIVHVSKRFLHGNFFVTFLFSIFGLVLCDLLITFIYSLVGVIHLSWEHYWLNRLLPTVFLNIIFFLLMYFLLVKRFIKWGSELNWD
ncbi:rod shape-determining protein MreD [Oceanobacillus sp. Castelsardo]|uniref:rod shape-determining protein MreD n=1 Tax=Oceanobacillus sp. Castelsardo TaxID=1851204 RepID=UPI0008387129|nr:rod shape-determining protein MreD [Oceanobacillus sp. Castelsardo]